MCHPTRRRLVHKLAAKLDQKPKVVWDRVDDRWDTGRRALLAYQPDADFHLVLQDDAVVSRRLVAACEAMLEHTPGDVPVSLYMGRWRHRPRRFAMKVVAETARARGASFAVFGGPWWGPGIILPTADVEAVVAYGDENPKRQPNYDLRIAQFYAAKGVDCWYTMPSLIDLQPGQSLTGRKGSRRHAQWRHSGPYEDLDWSGGIITPADMELTQRFPVTP
jgi:hypothetical protein